MKSRRAAEARRWALAGNEHEIRLRTYILGVCAVEYLHPSRKPWSYRQTEMVPLVRNLSRYIPSGAYSIYDRGCVSDGLRHSSIGMGCIWLIEVHQVL